MNKLVALGPSIHPAPVTRILLRHSREEIEGFISVAISLLDLADGDPDLEEDDPSGVCDEDGINTYFPMGFGPGCIISDGDNEHDGREEERGEY